ncbi:MAG: nitrilase-related carbon-nitrogen hydrolase [Planctomycetota bacterium]
MTIHEDRLLPVPPPLRETRPQLQEGHRQAQPGPGRSDRPARARLHGLPLQGPRRGEGLGAEKARDKYFNSALLLGPRGIRRVYRKLHFFMDENSWFDPGDKELGIDRVRGARIGMMICFDWVFPEVARTLALAGADVICHPSDLVLGHCQQAMLTRSLENGVFSVTANRFGTDRRPHGEVRFTGRSQIVGPRGELLFRAPAQRDVLQVMEIDPARARDKAITPRNQLLKDRRPQFYA